MAFDSSLSVTVSPRRAHFLEHFGLKLVAVNVVIALVLVVLLNLLHAFLEFKVVDFLAVHLGHCVVVGEQFLRAVDRREDEQQQCHAQDRDNQDGALSDLLKC